MPMPGEKPRFSSLPSEIIASVFENCSDDNTDPSSIALSLTLSQINHRTRSIALQTRCLWSKVTIKSFKMSVLAMAGLQFVRSGNHPLSLILDFHDPEWDFESTSVTPENVAALLTLILPHAHRWKDMVFRTDEFEPIHALLVALQSAPALPLLERLTLVRANGYLACSGAPFTPAELRSPIPLLGGRPIPRLRELTLSGVHTDWSKCEFSTLRKLTLRHHAQEVMPTWEEFSGILGKNQGLEKLEILGWGPILDDAPVDEDGDPVPAVLPNVTSVHLGTVDGQYTTELAGYLAFPAMTKLVLEDITTIDPLHRADSQPILHHLANAANAVVAGYDSPAYPLDSLESFVLANIDPEPAVLEDLLSMMPSLELLAWKRGPEMLGPSSRGRSLPAFQPQKLDVLELLRIIQRLGETLPLENVIVEDPKTSSALIQALDCFSYNLYEDSDLWSNLDIL
ncbi:hypothetical protein DL96DRAFT_101161 [Flagelloscypha sp. PMI_526]|nr:hypothetical protein DL96DRAFT_101161 [Flagelloscypha sp. PMI_526]